MEAVQAQVLSHYRSEIVERIRAGGGVLSAGELTVKLAKEFGFCYGVERAIDLAYAARKYFPPDKPIYLLGEMFFGGVGEVNRALDAVAETEFLRELDGEFAGGKHAAAGADAFDQFAAIVREHLRLHRLHDVGAPEVDFFCIISVVGCGGFF